MDNYTKQATDFLSSTNTVMTVEFLKNDYHFQGDTDKRDIYKITFKRGQRKFSLDFGQSTLNSTKLVDPLLKNEFTMSGGCLKGRLKITGDIEKYKNSQGLKEVKGTPPTAYDVLTCLQKYEIDTFDHFCDEFGYDTDSISAKKTYKACLKEYTNVCKIWSDEEIELLQEIQ